MEVHDLYKLLHQGVFGSEHAVPDRSTAAEWLRKEIAELEAEEERPGPRRAPAGDEGRPPVSGRAVHARDGAPLVEPIAPDGAVVRVHLRPFLAAGGDPEALLDAFVATANQPRGDAATFRCAAEAAGAAVGARWPDGAWPAYVEAREAEGLPAVHHSDRFAAAYRPAYRVVGAEGAAELLKIRASFRR